MTLFDLPLEELRDYRPRVRRPEDFDAFWQETLDTSRALAAAPVWQRVETRLALVDTYDLTFSGFEGQPIKAWLHVPAGAREPRPAVVEYIGYSGGRGLAWQSHTYAEAGYAHLVMDSRGQGWRGGVGDTPDLTPAAGRTSVPGLMTRGIRAPHAFYYRRLFTDAALILDAARMLPWVDPARVAVVGTSQGGGLAIAAAGLDRAVQAVCADVPFLCHIERALELTDADPYGEIVTYLAKYRDREEETLRTLSYVDAVHMAARAVAPALFSVALRDRVCPPSTVFAAYNAWGGEDRDIRVYPYNGHEGGGEYTVPARLAFLAERLR
ncbi:MAG: acetylxylan esterase [Microbacterium sp.]